MKNNGNEMMVSILTLAYNHEPYIRQCLDGIVMQQTNFKFELLVHDDASTDGTAEIIREYESKYPEIIKPIYQKENQYSKHVPIGTTYLYPRAQGKYIALCEGDDYWTDPLKLQKQVDFLEANPDYVMCSHRFKCKDEEKFTDDWLEGYENETYNLNSLINGIWIYHPLTVIFRNDALNLEEYKKYNSSYDAVLFYHILKKGKGFLLPDVMAIYRIHNGGVWSKVGRDKQLKIIFGQRFAIYSIEKTKEAATFLRTNLFKDIGRKWMWKNYPIMFKSLTIIKRHFGLKEAIKIFVYKMLLGRQMK